MVKAIIADDLTGAMDAGVQVLGQAPATVEVQARDAHSKRTSHNAIRIINTQTRDANANTAAERVRATCQRLCAQGQTPWFKKIDSTLRGNIGAELRALHAALNPCLVICTPALPAERRTVESGVLKIAGQEVFYTPYRDEIANTDTKANRSAVKDIIRKQWPECRVRNLTRLVKSKDILSALQETVDLLIVDATSDEDLVRLVAAGSNIGAGRLLWAGSAGLLKAMASYSGCAQVISEKVPLIKGPLILVAGTRRALAGKQVRIAINGRKKSHVSLNLELQVSKDGEQSWSVGIDSESCDIERAQALEQSIDWLRSGYDLVLCAASPSNSTYHSPTVANALSLFAGDALEKALVHPRALVLVGGDTAYACLCRLGIKSLALGGEVEPYVPWARVSRGAWLGTIVVTKAGGFGDHHMLSRVEKRLTEDYR